MRLEIADSLIRVSTEKTSAAWIPDGVTRPKAQMDGTLLEFTARWRGEKLQIVDAVVRAAELKREIRLRDDGALEMKLELSGPAFPRKLSRLVVFERLPASGS
jgi:hypothetical protein